MRKDKRLLILCSLLLAANILFIWGNSMMDGDASNAVSDGVMSWVDWLFGIFGDFGMVILRKLGHLTEFGCLGLLLRWFFELLEQKGIHLFSLPLLCGALVACVDETIQVFSPGRSSSILDVWIDVFGLCAGIILLHFGQALLRKRFT